MISMEGTGTGRGRTRRTDTGMIDILEMIGVDLVTGIWIKTALVRDACP